MLLARSYSHVRVRRATFTDDSDIASEFVRLCDCDGHPLATSDDLYLYARADVAQQIQDILDENDNNDNENE